ncbi:MAG TPA: phosphoenolpyruvate carboxykinase domain-containing protein, partial [Bacillota bacterium]|nr:phosphoenolpyruvate carboxykinase domain-containing protein [Bacillota bacterium]
GKVDAVDSPIGYLPKPEDINIEGLEGVTLDTIKDLLTIDRDAWLADVENIKAFYAKIGDHVPAVLYEELAKLEANLKAYKG